MLPVWRLLSTGDRQLSRFTLDHKVTLIEIVKSLPEHDPVADPGEQLTIYVRRPWSNDSQAILGLPNEDGSPVTEALEHKLDYFLEVSICREFISSWQEQYGNWSSLDAACSRLIEYAENDA